MENNRFYVEGTALMFNGISVFTYKEKRTAKGACEHLNDSIAKEDPIDHQVGDLLFSIHVGTENISIGSKTGDVSEFEILGALEIIKEDIKDQYYRKREDQLPQEQSSLKIHLDRLESNRLVNEFNKKYKVGDKIEIEYSDRIKIFTIGKPAFIHETGTPCFEEKSCFEGESGINWNLVDVKKITKIEKGK